MTATASTAHPMAIRTFGPMASCETMTAIDPATPAVPAVRTRAGVGIGVMRLRTSWAYIGVDASTLLLVENVFERFN